ncbi:MAG: hypothetical protein IIB28_07855, partial [Chloroflexi bacterium]|nr:hypothetical protein [Chloroflexota bacterium]
MTAAGAAATATSLTMGMAASGLWAAATAATRAAAASLTMGMAASGLWAASSLWAAAAATTASATPAAAATALHVRVGDHETAALETVD